MLGLSSEETTAAGSGLGVIGTAIIWLRSLGGRVTMLEKQMVNVLSVDRTPFVLNKDFEKACKEIKGDIKSLRTVTSDGFESIKTCLNDLECAKRLYEDREKREKGESK
jgi:hypothetical protein